MSKSPMMKYSIASSATFLVANVGHALGMVETMVVGWENHGDFFLFWDMATSVLSKDFRPSNCTHIISHFLGVKNQKRKASINSFRF